MAGNVNNYLIKLALVVSLIIFQHVNGIGQIPFIHYTSVAVTQNGSILGNPWAGGLNCPQFSEIDLNSDGLKDLVAFERNFYGAVKTYLNNGTSGEIDYHYTPEFQAFFPPMRNWMLLRDYNCDGKEDIFTSVPAGVAVYRNDTDPGGNVIFSHVTSLLLTKGLNGTVPLYVSPPDVPGIADIDNDGDLDILTFNFLGDAIEYHKNLSLENFENCDQLEFELKNACWGFFSEDGNNNTVTLFDTCDENVPNPEKYEKHAGSSILALDLTGNGSKDLVLGDLTFKNLVMLENGGGPTSSGMILFDTTFPSNTVPVDLTVFPASYHIDVTNDGLKDLIVAPNNPNTSDNFENIWFYKNEGTSTIPEFVYHHNNFLQESMIDVGERSFAVFFDENGDGLKDIVVGNFGYFIEAGNYASQLLLLRNNGTENVPAFEIITNDYAALAQYSFNGIYPAFGDLDNDGDEEMITGDEDGNLHYFRNDGGVGNLADFTLSQPNFKGINIGQSAKPQIIDVNRDGLKDLLVGERSGSVNYFQNTGTPESPDFNSVPTIEEFGQVDVMPECCTGYSAPFMVEDSVGNYMLYVGSEQGKLYLFNNIEGNLDGNFDPVDSLYLSAININVSGADINNDGKTELVFGEYGGGIGLLKNGTPQVYGFNEISVPTYKFTLFPNPANDFITLQFENSFNQTEIRAYVYSVIGKVVLEKDFNRNENQYQLDISSLNRGIYMMIVPIINNQSLVAKFVKQ
ncbi:MAG: T9SS type A sorting domain-containing protein [Bacteroidales bacterium]